MKTMFVKSSTLYDERFSMSGVLTLGPGFARSNVYPSGPAFATVSAPIAPPAPGRLSTTNCWPNDSVSFCPTSLAMMSFDAPGVNGTIQRTGRLGKPAALSAAHAAAENPAQRVAAERYANARTLLFSSRLKSDEKSDQK